MTYSIRRIYMAMLTVKQVAKQLNLVPMTVTRYIHKGKLKASRPGGRWLIDPSAVDEMLRENANEQEAKTA
jgi:excisionase family DNA binding protein